MALEAVDPLASPKMSHVPPRQEAEDLERLATAAPEDPWHWSPVCKLRGCAFVGSALLQSGLVWLMGDFDTALHLEEQHKAEGQADGYRCFHGVCLRALCYHTPHPYLSMLVRPTPPRLALGVDREAALQGRPSCRSTGGARAGSQDRL